jgi:hypothetical protein
MGASDTNRTRDGLCGIKGNYTTMKSEAYIISEVVKGGYINEVTKG